MASFLSLFIFFIQIYQWLKFNLFFTLMFSKLVFFDSKVTNVTFFAAVKYGRCQK